MSAGDIALLIGAVAGLITAVGAFISGLQRRAAADADKLERERNELRVKLEAAMRYMHNLKVIMASHGLEAPEDPAELRAPGHTERPL